MKHDNQTSPSAPVQHFLSLAAAAQRFDCSERTIRRMISNGELTGYRVGKRLVRVDATEVAALARVIPTTRTVA